MELADQMEIRPDLMRPALTRVDLTRPGPLSRMHLVAMTGYELSAPCAADVGMAADYFSIGASTEPGCQCQMTVAHPPA